MASTASHGELVWNPPSFCKGTADERKDVCSLLRMDAVVETHSVYGEYDLVARLDFNDSKEMTRFLIEQIRTIPGVVKTETLISAEV